MIVSKPVLIAIFLIVLKLGQVTCFWDEGTTTVRGRFVDTVSRTSFFRWQWVFNRNWKFWFWYWDWDEIEHRRRLAFVCGISIDMTPLSTAAILNRRIVVTAYNYLDAYMNRMLELRIWACGRLGVHNSPYRYRVWKVSRVLPWSNNPEHCHGPRCTHQPRHDVAVITARDQMYVVPYGHHFRFLYATRTNLVWGYGKTLSNRLWISGSGYENWQHVHENYKIIYFAFWYKIVDCSKYLPKWWGKFICFTNVLSFPGIQNGGPVFDAKSFVGVGCFEIRYNEDRIMVATDLRYYTNLIRFYAYTRAGWYYDYAYPQWGVALGWLWDSWDNAPQIPHWQIQQDQWPYG